MFRTPCSVATEFPEFGTTYIIPNTSNEESNKQFSRDNISNHNESCNCPECIVKSLFTPKSSLIDPLSPTSNCPIRKICSSSFLDKEHN